jgi:hypothetical protein
MVRHNPLSEWQKNSLSRPPHLYTADTVPNSEKLDVKWRFGRAAEESGELLRKPTSASRVLLQNSVRAGLCSASGLKLVPFVSESSTLSVLERTSLNALITSSNAG